MGREVKIVSVGFISTVLLISLIIAHTSFRQGNRQQGNKSFGQEKAEQESVKKEPVAKIAFASRYGATWYNEGPFIYTINPDATEFTQLTHEYKSDHPLWSPDRKKIAFRSTYGSGDVMRARYPSLNDQEIKQGYIYNIFVMNADGANIDKLTKNTYEAIGGFEFFTWSPDGKKIAFLSGRNYICIDVNTKQRLEILDVGENASCPFWSPDGTKLAFQSYHENEPRRLFELYWRKYNVLVRSLDGKWSFTTNSPHSPWDDKLCDNYNLRPWSPDGRTILFTSNRAARNPDIFHIYAMSMDFERKEVKQLALTKGERGDGQATWSPDGKKIAFIRYAGAWRTGDRLCVMNADGTDMIGFPSYYETAQDDAPCWSPDGKKIIFTRHVALEYKQILIANPYGTELKSLTGSQEPAWDPAW